MGYSAWSASPISSKAFILNNKPRNPSLMHISLNRHFPSHSLVSSVFWITQTIAKRKNTWP